MFFISHRHSKDSRNVTNRVIRRDPEVHILQDQQKWEVEIVLARHNTEPSQQMTKHDKRAVRKYHARSESPVTYFIRVMSTSCILYNPILGFVNNISGIN
mmetsp:Transcript_55978/g.65399  ORF Transcript_55978/g.65399 Transcript_55978/m.65399 type:complete len:100 (-) Transcript_55978:3-302(-)